jgi:hypothetical protein
MSTCGILVTGSQLLGGQRGTEIRVGLAQDAHDLVGKPGIPARCCSAGYGAGARTRSVLNCDTGPPAGGSGACSIRAARRRASASSFHLRSPEHPKRLIDQRLSPPRETLDLSQKRTFLYCAHRQLRIMYIMLNMRWAGGCCRVSGNHAAFFRPS